MSKEKDIKIGKLIAWDEYTTANADKALPEIYEHAKNTSAVAREWYWKSIKLKRVTSLAIRFLSFCLLVCGALLPILAGLSSDVSTRLDLTQSGVAILAAAGLLQAADRIFGWSSGWLRYITTVTAMEALTHKFELDWASYMINKAEPLNNNDKRPLFEMAKRLEDDISKLQSDETDKWCAEFNSSLAMLNDLIKSQRASAENAAEMTRVALTAQNGAREKARQTGGIELSIVHKADPVPVKIRVDDGEDVSFTGTVWSQIQVPPGQHIVHVTTLAPAVQSVQKIANVTAGRIEPVEVRLS